MKRPSDGLDPRPVRWAHYVWTMGAALLVTAGVVAGAERALNRRVASAASVAQTKATVDSLRHEVAAERVERARGDSVLATTATSTNEMVRLLCTIRAFGEASPEGLSAKRHIRGMVQFGPRGGQ